MSANRYAAMPSMHVGWTTLGAIALAACLPWRRVGYAIATIRNVAIVTTVIVTGNHYWLDAVAGWAVIAVSALVNRLLPYLFRSISRGCSNPDPKPQCHT